MPRPAACAHDEVTNLRSQRSGDDFAPGSLDEDQASIFPLAYRVQRGHLSTRPSRAASRSCGPKADVSCEGPVVADYAQERCRRRGRGPDRGPWVTLTQMDAMSKQCGSTQRYLGRRWRGGNELIPACTATAGHGHPDGQGGVKGNVQDTTMVCCLLNDGSVPQPREHTEHGKD